MMLLTLILLLMINDTTLVSFITYMSIIAKNNKKARLEKRMAHGQTPCTNGQPVL